ncbi:hypothetical protein QQF64_012797 [Cirrhinus molitorella]|uniref:Uncharacterized protein n=1 Tax=Cirrhinus molitorella TaxID=172907 RepID=A0ABR3LWI2_9TELE
MDEMMEDGREEQPICVSVLVFFCKGLIEAILLLIFTWMFLQVLISKHLEDGCYTALRVRCPLGALPRVNLHVTLARLTTQSRVTGHQSAQREFDSGSAFWL